LGYSALYPTYFIAFSSACDARLHGFGQDLRNPLNEFIVEISRRVELQVVHEFSRRGLYDLLPTGRGVAVAEGKGKDERGVTAVEVAVAAWPLNL
jgi:hypothetical protein